MLTLQSLKALATPANVALGLLVVLVVRSTVQRRKDAYAPKGTRRARRLSSASLLLGDTLTMGKNKPRLYDWVTDQCAKLQGEPFELRVLGRPPMTFLCTVQAFEEVLKTHFDAFPKGEFLCSSLRDLLGHGIFAVDHGQWLHQRKVAANLFSMRALRDSMTATVQEHASVLHRVLRKACVNGEPIDISRLLSRFTMEAFAKIAFGIEMNCLESEQAHVFQTAFDQAQLLIRFRFFRPSWFWKLQRLLDVGVERELRQTLAVFDNAILDIVAQSLEQRNKTKSATSGEHKDKTLVSLFLDNASDTEDVSPAFLRDMVVNFLLAGRDTTAQTMSWLFYRLDQNSHVVDKIRQEIAAKIPALASGEILTPSMQQVEDLVYLEAALKETLRLYPAVPIMNKIVGRDIVLSDGTFLRANTIASLPAYALGRMTNVWGPDAAEFKPERWIDPATGKLLSVSTFKFPAFNAGPRLCLGMNLAMVEMKVVVAGLLSHFQLQLVPDQHTTYGLSFTLPIKGALMVTVQPKAASI